MKPNGKYLVVRAVVFVLCMAGMFSAIGNAETAHGKFKLPTETRWGKVVLTPGEYQFTISNDSAGMIVTVSSKDSRWSGMIMSEGTSAPPSENKSELVLGQSAEGAYVRSLSLGEMGMMLNFAAPKAVKASGLLRPSPTQVASAAGSH